MEWESNFLNKFLFLTFVYMPIFFIPSGIGAGIWLAILGEWEPLVIGIGLFIILSSTFSSFLFLPSLLIAPGMTLYEKSGILKILGLFFMLAGMAWVFVVIICWGLFLFSYFISQANHDSLLPLTIWAASIAVVPWGIMAGREGGNDSVSLITVSYIGFASLNMIIMLGFELTSMQTAFLTFTGIMVVRYIVCSQRMIVEG